MYSPEKEELKRKISRIVTILVVLVLIAFPVYMLVIKDAGQQQPAPRIETDTPTTETRPVEPVERDTFESPVTREEQPQTESEEEPVTGARTQPETREREEPPRSPAPAPSIAGNRSLEFPQTPETRNISRSYIIQNTGNRTLEIRRVNIGGEDSNDFSLDQTGTIVIEPNDAKAIDVAFIPMTQGEKNAVLNIESNDPQRNRFQVALRGTAISEESVETVVRNLYEQGQEQFNSRNFTSAKELYTNVISLDPYYGPAYLMRGRTKYEQGEYIAALEDFDNVLKYRLSIPSDDRQRVECISLYYAALSMTEQAMRTENENERNRLLLPAMGRWEDFKGICTMDATLVENAGFWMDRLSELR